jgi:O-antigen/teichoic acid export membrane protein
MKIQIKPKDTKHQIVLNMLTGWIATASRVAIGMVMVPFLLKHLGKDGYGMIGLIGVVVSFSAIADLGLRSALGRELSEKVANEDVQGFRALSSTALVLYLAIAFMLIIPLWVLAPWFVVVFKIPEGLRGYAIWMIRLYGSGSVLLSFITPVFRSGLQSFMRFDAMNMVQTLNSIGAGILLLISISLFHISPLIVWAAVMFSALLFDLLFLWLLYRRWCFSGRLGIRYLDWRQVRPLFHLGGYMYVLQLTNVLSERSDPLVISYFFGPSGVALYNSGAKISQMVSPIVMTLSTQILPISTRYHVLNQQDNQRKLIILGTRYTLLIGVIVSAGTLLFAERFCRLWLFDALGSDYMTVVSVMQLWALVDLTNNAGAMHWPTLLSMKKLHFAVAIMVPSAVINFLISIYLIGFTRWGIPGALVATILTNTVRRPIAIWYISKLTGLSIRKYIRSAYMPPGLLLVLLMPSYYVLRLFPEHNWGMLILLAGLFVLYSLMVLSIVEYKLIVRAFREGRKR